METNPEPQRPSEKFVYPGYRRARRYSMPTRRIIIVTLLIAVAAVAFELMDKSYWYGVGGGVAVTVAVVLSWRYRHACSEPVEDDDLRKLYHARNT